MMHVLPADTQDVDAFVPDLQVGVALQVGATCRLVRLASWCGRGCSELLGMSERHHDDEGRATVRRAAARRLAPTCLALALQERAPPRRNGQLRVETQTCDACPLWEMRRRGR